MRSHFLYSPSTGRRSSPNQAGPNQPTLLLGFLVRSHPTFHANLFFQLGEALWHRPAVPVPGLWCAASALMHILASQTLTWGMHPCGSLGALRLPEHQNVSEAGCNMGHSRSWGGRKQAHGQGKSMATARALLQMLGLCWDLGTQLCPPVPERNICSDVNGGSDLTKGTAGGTSLQGVPLKRPPCCDKAPKSLKNEGKGSGRGLVGGIKGSAALEADLNHTLKQPTAALQ